MKKEREKGVLTTKNKENGKRVKQKTRSKNEKVTCEKCNNNFKTRKVRVLKCEVYSMFLSFNSSNDIVNLVHILCHDVVK